jgi:hypothetical protein
VKCSEIANGRLCSATKLENNVSDLMILSLRVLFAPDRNDELGFDWFWNEKSFKVF